MLMRRLRRPPVAGVLSVLAMVIVSLSGASESHGQAIDISPRIRELMALVNDAAKRVRSEGEKAFGDFRTGGSRWRQSETYIFVLDSQGNMLVHADPELEGRNQLGLQDVSGKPIIRGLIEAATASPAKPEGWYHYQWPVPGGLLPRWKSSYVRQVTAPSGKKYIVGAGLYDDRMERLFVVEMVKDAIGLVEKTGQAAFTTFRDPKSRFMAKDAYVFVIEPGGIELVNPAFANLEGRNLLDLKDTQGKPLVREMLKIAQSTGSGWVDYMWPKPGENVSTQKSTYVGRARLGEGWVLVGSGVYLVDAPRSARPATQMTARDLMQLVREAGTLLEQRGEQAYPELRRRGSRWYRDDTYFFVWAMDGTRTFHAADPALEGQEGSEAKDVLGRPYGRMFIEAASSPAGEGWVHYEYPEPGDIFPAWKSTFLKRVTFPSGQQHIVGSGIYHMRMDEAFIKDLVDRAAALLARHGQGAFDELRDRTGPYYFMDTYVFVDTAEGVELVNPGQPSLEGRRLLDLKDAKGKMLIREYIQAARSNGEAWVEYEWYKPGTNTPAHKKAYVKEVKAGKDTYYVGSGLYVD